MWSNESRPRVAQYCLRQKKNYFGSKKIVKSQEKM
jgi:hypothetical protein